MSDITECMLLPILPETGEVLCIQESGRAMLQRLEIPKGRRPAKELADWIWNNWGVSSVVLDMLSTRSDVSLAVVELLEKPIHTKNWYFALSTIDKLSDEALDAQTRTILKSICMGELTNRGPLCRIGWLNEAKAWIESSLGIRPGTSGYSFEQLNASGHFALIRFSRASGPTLWLKAVGRPNEHEFEITSALKDCVGEFLPPVLAMRKDWNAWLMVDAGRDLEVTNEQDIKTAAISLAKLQRSSIPHVDRLRSSGCVDQNLNVLRANVPEIIEFLTEAMSQQTSTKVTPLSYQRLSEIGMILQAACDQMLEIHIPDTLINNDINPGNILVNSKGCLFIDWAEGQIGNPFLTFERMKVHVFPDDTAGQRAERCCRFYAHTWRDLLDESHLERAFALAPSLAILSYLFGRGEWLKHSPRRDHQSTSYSRSLARHLDRAICDPELLRLI